MDNSVQLKAEPPHFLARTSLESVLVRAASRALNHTDCADLAMMGELSWFGLSAEDNRRAARAAELAALPFDHASDINGDQVAEWVVSQYAGRTYPGVVVGSRHGAAVHLAAALGAPWLPTEFASDLSWPGGCLADAVSAMAHGAAAASAMRAASSDLLVRQVHDPVAQGLRAECQVHLQLRWSRLPDAYQRFLDRNLEPGGFVLLARDVRAWSVLDPGEGYSFQLGSPETIAAAGEYLTGRDLREALVRCRHTAAWRAPTGPYRRDCGEHGVEPGIELGLRQYARRSSSRLLSLRYRDPSVFSAGVAEVYRRWLRANGKSGSRLVVECGRLIDPWQVIRTGAVPFWCENATRDAVESTELWLAGGAPFPVIDVLPESPGTSWSRLATVEQWASLALMASARGVVDEGMTKAYPLHPLAPRHATRVLAGYPDDGVAPSPIPFDDAVAALRDYAAVNGLLVVGAEMSR